MNVLILSLVLFMGCSSEAFDPNVKLCKSLKALTYDVPVCRDYRRNKYNEEEWLAIHTALYELRKKVRERRGQELINE